MAIRKYQKPHLCKHSERALNVIVQVKESCKSTERRGMREDYVEKKTCRECGHFELRESEGE